MFICKHKDPFLPDTSIRSERVLLYHPIFFLELAIKAAVIIWFSYNTLDFASKVVCHETSGFIGFFLPLKGTALHWLPPAKGTLSPLDSPANRELPAPIGSPEPKELLSLWNPSSF